MLLTIDLGNTSLKLAIFHEDKKLFYGLYESKQDDYGALIKNFLYRNNLSENMLEDCIISSVVPASSELLLNDVRRILNKEPIFIDPLRPLGIKVDTPHPEEVGSDLLVMCAYAYDVYKTELFVVSLGTATVISHVSADGEFKHCIIAPGYGKVAASLYANAAKLPELKTQRTTSFLANNTKDAMNVGLYLGYIGSLRYLFAGLKGELKVTPKIIACGGSWMVKKDLVAAGKFDEIQALTEEAVRTMLGFELRHIGVNCEDEAAADSVASKFDNLFGFSKKVGNSSIFAGIEVEAMKKIGRGTNGHIAIGTNSVARAKNYLESVKGVKFIEDSAVVKNGKLTAIYLEDEIGGFAIHLVQK